SRWGDFSYVAVDPTDDQTMWAFAEYCNSTNSWGVRAIQLKAPPPATPASCSPSSLAQGATANVIVTGTAVSGSGFYDTEPGMNRLAAAVSGTGVTVNSVTWTDATHATLNLSATAVAPTGGRNITFTNPDGQTAVGTAILTINGGGPVC